jgi:hypothetical protein
MSVGNAPHLWVCGACTYEHSLAEEMCFLACSMCGTPRPNVVVTTSTAVGNVADRTPKSTAQKVHISGWLGGTVAAAARRDHGDGAFGSPSKLDTSMASAAAAAASPTFDTSATAGATATAASPTFDTSTAAATPGATATSPTLKFAASQPSPSSSSHVVSTTADGAAVTAITADAGSPDDIDGHQSKRRRTFAELLRPRRSGDFVPRAKYVEPMITSLCARVQHKHAC